MDPAVRNVTRAAFFFFFLKENVLWTWFSELSSQISKLPLTLQTEAYVIPGMARVWTIGDVSSIKVKQNTAV